MRPGTRYLLLAIGIGLLIGGFFVVLLFDTGARVNYDNNTCRFFQGENDSPFSPSYATCFNYYCNATASKRVDPLYKGRLCDCCHRIYGEL
jgi:hypothetical protein